VDRAEHWQRIYASRSADALSWFEATPEVSLRRVHAALRDGARSVIDVGGGASRLVDALVVLELERIAVLDVSRAALDVARRRLGSLADRVEWIEGDVTSVEAPEPFDVWHDRAVFHFLTDRADRRAYVSLCERTVRPGGIAIVSTFAPDGPEVCSGLPVRRYSAGELAEECGPRFDLIDAERHLHVTPRGVVQPFISTAFRRVANDRVLAR
jgi:SAM-dependent methyltransferase